MRQRCCSAPSSAPSLPRHVAGALLQEAFCCRTPWERSTGRGVPPRSLVLKEAALIWRDRFQRLRRGPAGCEHGGSLALGPPGRQEVLARTWQGTGGNLCLSG